MITLIQIIVKSLLSQKGILLNLSQILGKLVTSTLPTQRAASVALYSELIGKVKLDPVQLEVVMNTLDEARADSSSLVRKQAIRGLSKIVYLEPKQVHKFHFIDKLPEKIYLILFFYCRLMNILITV